MLGLKHFQGKNSCLIFFVKAFYFLSLGMNKLKTNKFKGRNKCYEDLFYKSVSVVGHTFPLIHVFAKSLVNPNCNPVL